MGMESLCGKRRSDICEYLSFYYTEADDDNHHYYRYNGFNPRRDTDLLSQSLSQMTYILLCVYSSIRFKSPYRTIVLTTSLLYI